MKLQRSHIAFAQCLALLFFIGACSRHSTYPQPPRTGSDVVIDISQIAGDIPQFFSYHYKGKEINFFIVKMDGVISSFFDACLSCYPKKLGFRFEDGYVVCKACRERYPLADIDKGVGSCYPIKFTGSVRDGKYIIDVSQLEEMADKF